ncbi:hypothetical protein CV770_39085 [Bradyrhizobium sp. AC87j1]|uniref:hypothetical protein n=1 Tax=Bradyrhizobium sp. AC87j1 TaxID=2055894 RepID=UPI000CEC5F6E|nr:hypothetical protein [Bradyrhizobium sp. AC87j1]PPQ14046.1 hypothetical protein CV770_39085 [Bradyrhizobium sp. AC87j1]
MRAVLPVAVVLLAVAKAPMTPLVVQPSAGSSSSPGSAPSCSSLHVVAKAHREAAVLVEALEEPKGRLVVAVIGLFVLPLNRL